jgi:DNA-3-methyladenine glycosylase II|tara:strand:+ start:603 stop:1265 length:663 start_codon:yes stop_codon:yes gene_type:complete
MPMAKSKNTSPMIFSDKSLSQAEDFLSTKDPVMRALISNMEIEFPYNREVSFKYLARIIINQQLSSKAAATIYDRFCNLFGDHKVSHSEALKLDPEHFHKCGISKQKTIFIQNIAAEFEKDPYLIEFFNSSSNEAAYERLVQIKGIGQWSASAFLLFNLRRIDIFCVGDGTLNRAIDGLYEINSKDDPIAFDSLIESWKPYRSVACLYLWKWIDTGKPAV